MKSPLSIKPTPYRQGSRKGQNLISYDRNERKWFSVSKRKAELSPLLPPPLPPLLNQAAINLLEGVRDLF